MRVFPVFLGVCLLLAAVPVYGRNSPQGLTVSIHTGAFLPANDGLNPAFLTGFGLSYPLYKNFSANFDFTLCKNSVEEKPGSLLNGNLTVTHFLFSLDFSFLKGEKWTPYLFGGSGFVFADFEIGSYISIPEVTIRQRVDSGLCFFTGGGLRARLWRNFRLFAEVKYLYRKAPGKTIITDMNFGTKEEPISVNLSGLCIMGGIRMILR